MCLGWGLQALGELRSRRGKLPAFLAAALAPAEAGGLPASDIHAQKTRALELAATAGLQVHTR